MTDAAPEPTAAEQPVIDPTKVRIVITYDPPGQDPEGWEFRPGEWTVGEVRLIEQQFGQPRDDFFDDVTAGFETKRVFMLWLVRRRTEPKLQLKDLDGMLSPYIELAQIVEDDADQDAEDDPQPDAVNDPKDTPSGSDDKPRELPRKLTGSRTA